MDVPNAALVGGVTGAGGILVGLIVSKLMNRTATSIADLPKLEWRVEDLEKKTEASIREREGLKNQNDALWREMAKMKAWIDTAAELARAKGIELTTPRWGKEP